ncbi:uncharacterized protein UV8b_05555 [Ustilaginoidea virens]|uniref:Uncharacterized protein n=1 Tax=Ustilaginoidea virens TaxID=1159556 RepID=A0A8E5HTN8_USTVR|nr:uncharacterized protein UV8b_05555 [Ustilaginoidea virens]QUC21312.1 hypothetical protein UV8b_05555 [Ustilaginoidea virens]
MRERRPGKRHEHVDATANEDSLDQPSGFHPRNRETAITAPSNAKLAEHLRVITQICGRA